MSVVKSKGEILEVERGSLLSNLTLFSSFFISPSLFTKNRVMAGPKKKVFRFSD